MQATISRWGNSLALRLPRHVTDEARLEEGASVNIEVEDGSIRLTPTRKKFKLSELIDGHTRAESQSDEIDWGPPEGEEVW